MEDNQTILIVYTWFYLGLKDLWFNLPVFLIVWNSIKFAIHGSKFDAIGPTAGRFWSLTDLMWITDLQGALNVSVLAEFLDHIWHQHLRRNIQQGQLMMVSSKDQFLLALEHLEELGFFMWLVNHNKCWTVDRWLTGVCNIPLAAHCVTRKVKQLITFWWHVFTLGSFGLGCYKGWGSWTPPLNQESSLDGW